MPEAKVQDLIIIGGGVNGAGIARDAAGRGLSVTLLEQGDLAAGTSSASSKLIHGGLRYLEHYEFRLVRESLHERTVLLRMAPHIAWPMRFVMPHVASLRPALLIRLGLLLYDSLAGRGGLPGSRSVRLARHPLGRALREDLRRGFAYSDAWVDDARLVVLNAVDAAARGADIRTRCRVVAARREGGSWLVECADAETGAVDRLRARVLVNAAGPWASDVLELATGQSAPLRLVKGSHIVVPRLHPGPEALLLQNDDRRVVFVLPYEERFSLVGTTDVPHAGDPAHASATPGEAAYLCAALARFFQVPPRPADVVWSYAGVRPLYDDGKADASAITRDYTLLREGGPRDAPLLAVFGGKITTFRKLAEAALSRLADAFPGAGPAWTAGSTLPGGDLPGGYAAYVEDLQARKPWLPPAMTRRLARAYGTRADDVLMQAGSLAELGRDYGAGLHEAEIDYLRRVEFARTGEDILWRRTKRGLHMTPAQRNAALRDLG